MLHIRYQVYDFPLEGEDRWGGVIKYLLIPKEHFCIYPSKEMIKFYI